MLKVIKKKDICRSIWKVGALSYYCTGVNSAQYLATVFHQNFCILKEILAESTELGMVRHGVCYSLHIWCRILSDWGFLFQHEGLVKYNSVQV